MGDFAKNLLELRRKSEKTQKEVAAALGVAASAMSAYENGQREPSLDFAASAADYFGVSLDALCGIPPRPQGEGRARPFSRADAFRLVSSLCERMPGASVAARQTPSGDAEVTFRFRGASWLGAFCGKYAPLYSLLRQNEIDREVLDAWKEKQFAANEDIPADAPAARRGVPITKATMSDPDA